MIAPNSASSNTYIGRPMERVEDLRMLRGRGTYVADVNRPGQLYAVILRSSVAHGIIRSIDSSRARDLAGVRHVFVASDLGNAVPKIPLRLQPLPQLEPFHQPTLADGKVRYVGEPVAVVVADSQAIAEDALELIDVEIETLPAIVDRETAEAKPSLLFEGFGSNAAITWHAFKNADDSVFEKADYTRRERFKVQRHAAMFMEPRGFVAEWNKAAGKLTVWGAAKTAWHNRRTLAAQLNLDVEAVDLIEVDVGGGFGSRGEFYPEDYLIPAAAKMSGRPVKWTEDRREHMMTANHARDVECDVEIAVTKDGRFIGLRGQVWADIGAYLRTNGSVGPRNVAQYMSGPYTFEHIDIKSTMLMTNKTPCGTYRGPGRFETDFFRERLIDIVAKDLKIDRVEIRRKNLVADAQMPYPLACITPYDSSTELDSGDYHHVFDLLHEGVQLGGEIQAARQADRWLLSWPCGRQFHRRWRRRPQGRGSPGAGDRRDATVYMGSSSVGQGLETIMAQIAADATELPYERITILHGSTAYVKDGYGAYHSRSTVMGGSAILIGAEKLKAKIRAMAAMRFGCTEADVTLDGETVSFGGQKLALAGLCDTAIEVEAEFLNKKYTWAYGTQAAHIAVDPETGHVKVIDYLSVEDVGRMINPLTLHGQAIGSIVQGLGGAFLEHLVYDENGQLLTGSLADYLLPTTSDYPNIRSITLELKPCPNNPLGAKGAGEGGLIPVGGIMANAIADALSHLNVQPMELPLSPPKIWQMVQDASPVEAGS